MDVFNYPLANLWDSQQSRLRGSVRTSKKASDVEAPHKNLQERFAPFWEAPWGRS